MIKLNNRLAAVASLVQKGAHIADVGCDHGYVCAYLVAGGIAAHAIATDVHAGPLKACQSLIDSMGLRSVIDVRLCDGFQGVEAQAFDTAIIAGMGGELMERILADCPYITEKVLILQPMTHIEVVRRFLFENGFRIDTDRIVNEGRHAYAVLRAVPDGRPTAYTQPDLYLGKCPDFSNRPYYVHMLHDLENKQKSGADYSAVISKIKENI